MVGTYLRGRQLSGPQSLGLALLLAACGSGKDPLDSATGMTGMTGSPTGSPTGNPTTDPTDGGATDTDGSNPAICEQYLACVAAVTPETLSGAEATFGPDGTCWQGDAALAQQCLDLCQSSLDTLGPLFPNEPACGAPGTDTTGTGTSTTGTTGTVDPPDPTTGTSTTTGITTEPPDTTTDPGPCTDPPNQPQSSACTDASGCGCSSGICFIVPALGGFCGECAVDRHCDGGGCTVPNPIAGVGSKCNLGQPGDGCQSDAVCVEPDDGICGDVFTIPGIIHIATCGHCQTDADCTGPQAPNCTPTYDLPNFTGKNNCVPDGSVPNDQGCSLSAGGEAACASGHCGEANIMGLFQLGVCGECSSNADCGPGQTCSDPAVDLDSGVLIGAQCL